MILSLLNVCSKHDIFIFLFTFPIVPAAPKEPVSEILNETAVRLMWSSPDNPNGIILVYQVIYYGYKPLPETKEKRVCGDSTPITFFCACVHVSFIY